MQLLKTESHQTLLLELFAAETTVPWSKVLLEASFSFPKGANKQPPSLPEGEKHAEEETQDPTIPQQYKVTPGTHISEWYQRKKKRVGRRNQPCHLTAETQTCDARRLKQERQCKVEASLGYTVCPSELVETKWQSVLWPKLDIIWEEPALSSAM